MNEQKQEFSTIDQVNKAYHYLANVKTPVCTGCKKGISMCYHMPCMGTVEDMERLLDAGYAKNIMLDWWCGGKFEGKPFKDDVAYLVPAIEGLEGKSAPFIRHGKCNLLVDNLCSLHDKGLKPIQGRMACCTQDKTNQDTSDNEVIGDERHNILHTWNTQKGKDLIERWKIEVNYEGDNDREVPENGLELLASFIDLTLLKLKHHHNMFEKGLYEDEELKALNNKLKS